MQIRMPFDECCYDKSVTPLCVYIAPDCYSKKIKDNVGDIQKEDSKIIMTLAVSLWITVYRPFTKLT